MSAAKKKPSFSFPAAVMKFAAMMVGPGRPVLILGALVAVLAIASCVAWHSARDFVLSSDDYLVTPRKVELTPPPPTWIHTDIAAEVFRSASLDCPMSLMDADLTKRVSAAFALHPWIAKVHQVTKQHPAWVRVDVDYRRPVCMVEVADDLFPVDAKGVLLPVEDFSPVEASRYPRLVDIDTIPVGTAGESWGDARVLGGAEIADALNDAWDELKLARIVPSATGIRDDYSYTLVTRGGTRIRWGLAPGARVPGEPSAADRLARLRKYVARHGSLEGRDGPQELDIRDLRQ